MTQLFSYCESEMWRVHSHVYMSKIEEILSTPDDSDNANFVEVDLKYPDNIKGKTKNFPFCPENKITNEDKYNAYMSKIKPI